MNQATFLLTEILNLNVKIYTSQEKQPVMRLYE